MILLIPGSRGTRNVQIMKRKTSKEVLAESFYELSKTREIDKITIKDIAENCGYSPATFYRQFRDKYDLIAWAYSEAVSAIMDQVGGEEYTWKETLLDGARLFMKEKEYLSNLLLHTSGHDAFIRYMTDVNYKALRKHILKTNDIKELDDRTDLYIRIYCLGTVNLSCEWILGKYDAAPEEIAEVYENSVPQPLLEYLK